MPKLTRRETLAAGALSVVAPAILSMKANAAGSKSHICLVHGAWHGAWAWTRVVPLLIEKGFSVSALDLSGLGANAHRQSLDIGLHVHGQDILSHLFFNDYRDAVVVGHSYGGGALSQALAGDKEGRIAHAIYLDAFLLAEGEAVAAFQNKEVREGMERSAAEGKMIPPRARETWEKIWGLKGEPAEFSAPRMRPMSPRCFLEQVQGDPFDGKARLTYMRCKQNDNDVFKAFSKKAKADSRFTTADIDGHHNVMVIDPLRMRDDLIGVL
ncbi:MAG: alpha/beta fold hydrolase [Hyphomicrobiaceae bacterium]